MGSGIATPSYWGDATQRDYTGNVGGGGYIRPPIGAYPYNVGQSFAQNPYMGGFGQSWQNGIPPSMSIGSASVSAPSRDASLSFYSTPSPVQPTNPSPPIGAYPMPGQPTNPGPTVGSGTFASPVQPTNPSPPIGAYPMPGQPLNPSPPIGAYPMPGQPLNPSPPIGAYPMPGQPLNPAIGAYPKLW